jgi:hypothetical protein
LRVTYSFHTLVVRPCPIRFLSRPGQGRKLLFYFKFKCGKSSGSISGMRADGTRKHGILPCHLWIQTEPLSRLELPSDS